MKKNIVGIACFFLGISCTVTPKYYQGYIYSTEKKPISNIKICEQNSKNVLKQTIQDFLGLRKAKIQSMI